MVDQVSTITDNPTASSVVEDSGAEEDDVTLLPTVDDPDGSHTLSEETITTEDDKITESEKEDAEKDKETEEGKVATEEEGTIPTKYSDDPAWQRILRERNEAREANAAEKIRAERAEGQVEVLKGMKPEKEKGKEAEKPEYENVTDMDRDTIIDKFNEDPKTFLSNLARQVRAETLEEVKGFQEEQTQEQMQSRIAETFDAYAKENADFDSMWNDGSIQSYMKAHPGHNAISAHRMLTEEARIDAAVAKAKKETEARVLKEVKSKQHSKVLGEGPGLVPDESGADSELKDTKTRGGFITVAAEKLRRQRQQA